MADKMYFIINNCDGDAVIEMVTREELERRLENPDDYYGEDAKFLEEFPKIGDTNCWPQISYLIIYGEVVTPKPKIVVKKFELPR